MYSTLVEYEKMSNRSNNLKKSRIFFSNNVSDSLRMSISKKLGVSDPLVIGR